MSEKEDKYNLGKSFIFPKEVMNDIHIKSDLGRYRMRGFSLFKKIPTWDDLTFMPGTLTRFVIEGYREKCLTKTIIGPEAKRPLELDIPIYVTGMSFGALSYEAKTALARGATMAGTATCSGEGGMIPDERRYSSKWLYQCIQSRYGFNPNHLRLADAVEFFIGQGCKVHLRKDELPQGKLIVRVSKHITSVIDGVINDTYDCSRGATRCVYGYYIEDQTNDLKGI